MLLEGVDSQSESVTVELDHSHSRAYVLETSGRVISVTPKNDLAQGQCTLHVKSAVKIYNHTAVPLEIMRDADASMLGQMIHNVDMFVPVGNLLTPRVQSVPDRNRLPLRPESCVHVPLNWFATHRQKIRIQPCGHPQKEELTFSFPQETNSESQERIFCLFRESSC